MDSSQHTTTALEELRRIEAKAKRSVSIEELRKLFERVQTLRRVFPDNFDLQLYLGDVQQQILDRGRQVQSGKASVPPPETKEPIKAAEIQPKPEPAPVPPGVRHIDAKSWARSVYIGIFFALIVLAAFFYVIQAARQINIPQEQQAQVDQQKASKQAAQSSSKPSPAVVPPTTPTLRLYTDLVPGTVSIDDQPPKDLEDGELQLDNLKVGEHSIRVAGRGGDASFTFTVQEKSAPTLKGEPAVNNVMAVLVSSDAGKAQMMTSSRPAELLVDGKPAGAFEATGLKLDTFGSTDHTLEIKRANDNQRFVFTSAAAPMLTAYIKSDPNAGTLVVEADQDDAEVLINDKPYRRKTTRGQVRLPNLKVGDYAVKLRKPGFEDSPMQTIHIRKGEEARATFHLPAVELASLSIQGAQSRTAVYVDGALLGLTAANGSLTSERLKPGEHTVELRADQSVAKRFNRTFVAGQPIVFTAPDTTLERAVSPQTATASKPETPPPSAPKNESPAAEAATAQGNEPAAATAAPAASMEMDGSTVRHGGGFVRYHSTKTPGRYSFAAQLRKGGGFLKKGKIQWFAAYQDADNYVLFQLDGKKVNLRRVENGKGTDLRKVSVELNPEEWVQVDMNVKADSINARVRSAGGEWQSLGVVPKTGQDLTNGSVGFLIPGNDELAIGNFRYTAR